MRAISLDLRERILASGDSKEGTRAQVADRYKVSLGLVKKLLAQRRTTGEIGPRYHRCGRPPTILPTHRRRRRALVRKKPDLTLRELREGAGLKCSLPSVHRTLRQMGLTYKKRPSAPASRTGST